MFIFFLLESLLLVPGWCAIHTCQKKKQKREHNDMHTFLIVMIRNVSFDACTLKTCIKKIFGHVVAQLRQMLSIGFLFVATVFAKLLFQHKFWKEPKHRAHVTTLRVSCMLRKSRLIFYIRLDWKAVFIAAIWRSAYFHHHST